MKLTWIPVCLLAWPLPAASPWIPDPGSTGVTISYINESYRDFWAGPTKATLPLDLVQHTAYTFLEYGLARHVSADVETGYTKTTFGSNSLSGVTDTTLSLRWQFLRGENWVSTLRVGGTIAGSYPLTNQGPYAPGDQASGVEGSWLAGTTLRHGFYTNGEIGFRYRQKPVPNDFFFGWGGGQTIHHFTYGANYRQFRGLSGLDVGGPGFTPDRFPELQRIYGLVDFDIGYITRGGHYVGFNYGFIPHGRNVGVKRIFAITVGFNIPTHGPFFKR